MSIITPKLDYARHRNTSRSKINKSTLELKDATNLQNNQYDLLSQQEISTPSVQSASNKSPKPLKEDKGAPDDLANLFGQNNFYSGNLDYLTGLINTNKSTTNKSRDPSNTKGRKAHQRTRSTLQGISPQNLKNEPTVNNENLEPSLKVQTPQIALSLQTPISIGTTQASSLKPDIEYETGVLTLDMEKSPTPRHNFSQREPNNTPVIKEERLFDQFFQKGGLIRRSMSLEDLRLEKRGGGASNIMDENKSYGLQSPTELKSFVEKSSDHSHRLRGDFASNLTSYISYFDRSEAISQKAKQKIMNKYFVKNEAGGKGSQFLKKELEIAHNEMKGMKRHMESLQNKVFELVKMNKHLIKELGDMKTREDDYLSKLNEIEGQFMQINQRKDHYKLKYLQAHEMLEIERGENENNVVLLKKLLSSNHNIHNTLETKMAMPYSANTGTAAMRDKAREKEHLKNALKEAIQHKKESGINMTRLKEKKPSGAHIYSNNRYDPQYNQKPKKTREMSKYNISSMLQKPAGGMRSEEEEYLHHNNENNEASEASQRHVNFEESEGEDEEGQQEDYEKMLTKEQQIKLLQEKLLELEGTQDTHQFAYEKNLNQKKMMKQQQHNRGSDISPQNIFTIREKERKTSHMKASQLPMRYDHHVKMKNKNEMGMESPGGEAMNIHNFRSQNDSD